MISTAGIDVSAKVIDDLNVGFNERIGPEPGLVANQNPFAGAMKQDPKPVHISQFFEQSERDRNVVGSGRGEVVVSSADQLFATVPEEFGEASRDADVFSIAIDEGGVGRRNAVVM